jgi:hypothetical protein
VQGVAHRSFLERHLAGEGDCASAVLQRFGGALNLNVHIHALVLDGCYVQAASRHADRAAGASERTLDGAPPPRHRQWADLMRRSSTSAEATVDPP